MRIVKVLLIWLLILFLAFVNGGLRELILLPTLGVPYALVLSGVMLSACVLAVTAATLPRISPLANREAAWIGAFWLLLTLVFEFGFGFFVQHKPWHELLEAYTFANGNIWPIVLVVILIAPLLAKRLQNSAQNR